MTLITCEECLHKAVCPICFSYKDVLNVKDYCEHFADKSALEKQIPKKPIMLGYREGREINTISYTCPICNKHTSKESYCKYCGQALDWGDD